MQYRVRDIAKEKGLTLEALATSLGYSRQNLTKTLANNPTIGTLEKIATALGVEVTELFSPQSDAKAVCPHCGKLLTIKVSER